MENNFKMVAKTLFGFEELLAKELRNLGAQDVKIGVRNVSFVGDKGFMYKANLALRTAIKILKPIKTFRVVNEQDLYERVKAIVAFVAFPVRRSTTSALMKSKLMSSRIFATISSDAIFSRLSA
jgi:23S rRNA G2445 N2-methylase RlmL